MADPTGDTYPAYLTTRLVGGPRTPITGERIVVDLGQDEFGNLLELSLDLAKHSEGPGTISAYAIVEPLPQKRPTHLPKLDVNRGRAVNSLRLVVKYEPVPNADQDQESDGGGESPLT